MPNQVPADAPGARRLAIIGECPGLDELTWRVCPQGHGYAGLHREARELVETRYCPDCGSTSYTRSPTPFVGPSGRLLNWCLRQAGFDRSRVFVGNCSQTLLTAKELDNQNNGELAWGQYKLKEQLAAFRPNCLLLLGNIALRCFHPRGWTLMRDTIDDEAQGALGLADARDATRASTPKWAYRITDWRGSIFESDFGGETGGKLLKCVAACHPAACLRQPEWTPLMVFDVARAVDEALSADARLPQRTFDWQNNAATLCAKLRGYTTDQPLGFDIEGWATTGITDCSFARTPNDALWVPLRHSNGHPWWSPSDQQQVMDALRAILENPVVPKVCHNGQYEAFVLQWAHRIRLEGLVDDTMLLWHELFPELDKTLNVPASILTRQPYWGDSTIARNDEERALYNCTDSCVTLELKNIMLGNDPTTGRPFLTPRQLEHYRFNMSLLEPALWQMLEGMNYDTQAARALRSELQFNAYTFQGELDGLAGIQRPTLDDVAQTVCAARKRGTVMDWPDVVTTANPKWNKPYE